MTARLLPPTDQALSDHLAALASSGHVVTPQELIGGVKYRCRGCQQSVRHYTGHAMQAIFTDFEEDDQCPEQQMNMMTLRTSTVAR